MKDPIKQIANLVDTPRHVVDQVINQVQKLLDKGMWFSDACEIVALLTPLNTLLRNFNDNIAMSAFWDFISDNCISPRGVTPIIPSPMF